MVKSLDELKNADRNLFTPVFAVRALRDSRYHNSAYAIAELVDNSVEAEAERIELLCMEESENVNMRKRRIVTELAVLDNGDGMDALTLLEALKFGGGTHHDSDRGIGKYGMGLPTSSMSQCKKVDVWTWQDGISSLWHSSIDAEDLEQSDYAMVPVPDQDTPIPDEWIRAGSDQVYESSTGTLVVWSKLDKIQWKTAGAIIDNTSREVGRIHRHFIDVGLIQIRTAFFLKNSSNSPTEEYVVANDPLYLMNETSTPAPWGVQPMFTTWGKKVKNYPVTVDGKEVNIAVKYSIVRPEALKTDSIMQYPGATEHGKHARHNIGVSVVREDREIVLEDAFLREGGSAENPQNRWWGCEVQFGRSCDEMFGVDHNKQMVANFTQVAKSLSRDDRSIQTIRDAMGIDDEDIIYQLVGDIRNQTRAMMAQIGQYFKQRKPQNGDHRPGRRTPEDKAVQTATDADQDAIATGNEKQTDTDKDRATIPAEIRVFKLTKQFTEFGQTRGDAKELANQLVRDGISYQFNPAPLDGYQMFNVRSNQGILHINLNTDHPIYDLLKHIETNLDEDIDESNPAFQAIVTIRLLLSAWARMEDQTESSQERRRIQDISMNWGRQVDKVINHLRDREE